MEGIRVLGPVLVRRGEAWRSPGGERRQTLLGLFIAARGRFVTTDELLDGLGGGRLRSDRALVGLRNEVHRVRVAIDGTGAALHTRPGGYELVAGDQVVDVAAFESLVREAGSGVRDPHDVVHLADEALARWRGRPFGGLGDRCEPLAMEERRLHEMYLRVAERRLACLLASGGEPSAIMADAEALAAAYPYREGITASLVIALYRAGRQVDALACFRAARRALVDELGIEPSPALSELESRILRQDPTLDHASAENLALDGRRRPASRLPNYATSFIGRQNECAALVAALADRQLVTIVGPGGVGKTRLAVEVARQLLPRYPDGIAYVELAPIPDGDAVAHRVASVLRVTPHDAAGLLDAIVAAIEHRRCLVVLDNCEHVRSAAHDFVDRLLAASETVSVLATSRERLGLASEQVWPVPSLDPGSAGAVLFTDRALAADPSFELGDDQDTVVELCRRVDGLPLAIELVAARSLSLTPRQLLEGAVDGGLLGRTWAEVHDRHRTLRSAIDWSVQLLGDADRRLLARLSTFAGPATLVDLRAVCAGAGLSESDVVEGVERLVDKSLLVAGRAGDEYRYSLLETVRAHARECLAGAGEVRALATRHASHVQDRLVRIRAGLRGREELAAATELDGLWPDLRAAVTHGVSTGDVALVTGIIDGVGLDAHLRERFEVGDWIDRATDLPGFDDDGRAPQVLALGSALDAMSGRWTRAVERSLTADRVARVRGAPCSAEWALAWTWAAIASRPATLADGEALRRAAAQAKAAGDIWGALKIAVHMEMAIDTYLGRHAQARARIAALRPEIDAFGNPHLLADLIAAEAIHAADPSESARLWRSAIERIEALGLSWTLTPALNYLGATLIAAGRYDEAVEVARRQVRRLRDGSSRQSIAATVRNCIVLLGHLGRPADAVVLATWLDAQPAKIPSAPSVVRQTFAAAARARSAAGATSASAGYVMTGRVMTGNAMTTDDLIDFIADHLGVR